MKTIEQKRVVIDEYNKSTKELLPRMMAAIASRRKDKMEEIYKEHVSLCLPVMQTYSDAIVDAVNPINERIQISRERGIPVTDSNSQHGCECPQWYILRGSRHSYE